MNPNLISAAVSIIIILWAIFTTLIGLWLSWKNNYKYNADILTTLRSIDDRLKKMEWSVEEDVDNKL